MRFELIPLLKPLSHLVLINTKCSQLLSFPAKISKIDRPNVPYGLYYFIEYQKIL